MTDTKQKEWIDVLESLTYPTPFKLTRTSILRHNVEEFKKALPRVEVFYAIKSASDKEIIEAIDDLVDGYDIASLGEHDHLKKIGVNASRMIYSNPVKVPKHIEKTFESGVQHFAFDSIGEIKKIAEFAPGANVYLRLKVSDYGSKFPLSKKFGADPINAVAYMDVAREFGLNPIGLSFHVGSQSESPQTWEVAFETVGATIKRLSKVGINIELLDIGGGVPATYVDRIPTIKEIAQVINNSIDEHIPDNIRIISEPGRYISADASVIVSKVIGRAHRGSEEWLFLDMGVFQGLMESLEMSNWRFPVFTKRGNGSRPSSTPFTLTGPSCDAYDTIGFEYFLPPDLDVGDRLYIGSAGAYTTVYESNFNGFEPPEKYYVK